MSKPVEVNDEFAKRMGLEDLAKLREAVSKEIEQELTRLLERWEELEAKQSA